MLPDFLRRKIEFVAWGNFTDPEILLRWGSSLAFLFLFLLVALAAGRILTRNIQFLDPSESLVFTGATGFCLLSFSVIGLGFLRLLNPVSVGLAGAVFLFWDVVAKRNMRELYQPISLFVRSVNQYKWLWVLFCLNSFPALLPPYRWDSMSYHLPYVRQWAEAGTFTVDATMRIPLHTFNFHMLHLIGMLFNSTTFVHLLSWITGCLACLAIICFLRRLELPLYLAVIAGLSFFLSPLVQRYLTNGYFDVPLMFFLLMAAYGFHLLHKGPDNGGLILVISLIAAMFVGMKNTGLVYFPLFMLAAFLILIRRQRKHFLVFALVFLTLGSIWYLRNLAVAGDPIAPTLNILLGKNDPFWDREDYFVVRDDLTYGLDKDFFSLVTLPWEMVTSQMTGRLRDYPLNGFILIFPLSLVFISMFYRKRLWVVFAFAWFSVAVWIHVSYLIRYAHFTPLAVVMAACILNSVFNWVRVKLVFRGQSILFAIVAAVLMLGPTKGFASYYIHNFSKPIPKTVEEIDRFVGYGNPADLELIRSLEDLGIPEGPIYAFGFTYYKYYFNLQGFYLVGDDIGKFGVNKFVRNLKEGTLSEFFSNIPVGAMIFDKAYLYLKIDEKQFSDLMSRYSESFERIVDNEKVLIFKRTD